jgi:hypothetical protein
MYDPTLGVFTTRDPIAADENLYRYCGNDPMSLVDPTGLGGLSNNQQITQGKISFSGIPTKLVALFGITPDGRPISLKQFSGGTITAADLKGNTLSGFRAVAGLDVTVSFTPSKKGEECYYWVQYTQKFAGLLNPDGTVKSRIPLKPRQVDRTDLGKGGTKYIPQSWKGGTLTMTDEPDLGGDMGLVRNELGGGNIQVSPQRSYVAAMTQTWGTTIKNTTGGAQGIQYFVEPNFWTELWRQDAGKPAVMIGFYTWSFRVVFSTGAAGNVTPTVVANSGDLKWNSAPAGAGK